MSWKTAKVKQGVGISFHWNQRKRKTLHICDHFYMGNAWIEKRKTCGPPFLVGKQKLQKKILSMLHRLGVKSEQWVGGISDIADYI